MTEASLFTDQLRLLSSAAAYDLGRTSERSRSMHDLVALFYGLQEAVRPAAFAEIGAFEAQFSRDMKAAYPAARVVAFEGNPVNADYCRGRHDYAALGVEYRACLVSENTGLTQMMIQKDRTVRDGNQLKRNDSLLPKTKPGVEYAPLSLPTVTLDEVFAPELAAGGDFSLWIDVEGAVERIVKGAGAVLARTRTLLVEVEEHAYWEGQWLFDDVHRHLLALGFTAVARDYEYEHQFNVIYVDAGARSSAQVRARLALHAARIGRPASVLAD